MILLRKRVDAILIEFELDILHIERKDNGFLTLSGPCGKNIININGLIVPRKINNVERDYIFEQVDNYIRGKVEDIKFAIDYNLNPYIPEEGIIEHLPVYDSAPGFTRVSYTDSKKMEEQVKLTISSRLDCRIIDGILYYNTSSSLGMSESDFNNQMDSVLHLSIIKSYAERSTIKKEYDNTYRDINSCVI